MTDYDLENLKYDKIKESTGKAQEYLKINMEIRGLGPGINPDCHLNEYVLDQSNNKIFYTNWEKIICNLECCPNTINGENLSNILKTLTEKVKENEELFSQLDFMMRNYPKDELKSCHVQLISHQLSYWSSELLKNWASSTFGLWGHEMGVLIMNDSVPLFNLGCIASMLVHYKHVIIQTTKETAAVCYLFTQLCHDVGLHQHLTLACVEEHQYDFTDNLTYLDFNKVEGVGSGCTGVVMARSDLDSALDTFLASSLKSPWKLRRILVQESVFERFKKTLEWKCRMNNTDSEHESSMTSACAGVFACGGKVFMEGGGAEGGDGGEESPEGAAATCLTVQMEAFRTVKELLSLVRENPPPYLSVWASDISEANEVSSELDAPMIWLNQYANFNGPPKISQAVYPKMNQRFTSGYVDDQFLKTRRTWSDLDNHKRSNIIFQELDKHLSDNNRAKYLRESLLRADQNCFVEFEPGTMCVGLDKPLGIVGQIGIIDDKNYFYNAMNSVMLGNGLVCSKSPSMEKEEVELVEILQRANIPIMFSDHSSPHKNKMKVKVFTTVNFFQTKVIYTIFGTIFAN